MSCCGKQQSNLKDPLLPPSTLSKQINYESINDFRKISQYAALSSLLDPSGHLSEELVSVLDEVFMKYSNGFLIMNKKCLINYYKNCYPDLSQEKYYDDRAQYILNKYGKTFKEIKSHLKSVINNDNNDKHEIIDTYSPHTNRRRGGGGGGGGSAAPDEEETKYDKKEETKIVTTKSKHHSISIHEERSVIDSTISLNYDETEIVLLKTKYLLLYRKSCVDKPMMVRLELTELGYEQFRSGMLLDRTKQLDKLAFNIQQLRNRHSTHLEERKRIDNAASPNECASNIEKYIAKNIEPLDSNNDNNNLFRKRRPIKFPKCCHAVCCCFVGCIRCCES